MPHQSSTHESRSHSPRSSPSVWSGRLRGFLKRYTDIASRGTRRYPEVSRHSSLGRVISSPLPELEDTSIVAEGGTSMANPAAAQEAATKFIRELKPLSFADHAETDCPICMEPLSDDPLTDKGVRLPNCTHVFGLGCIRQWIRPESDRPNNSCPTCRAPLFTVEANGRRTWPEMLADIRQAVEHLEALHQLTQRLYAYDRHEMYAAMLREASARVEAVRRSGHGEAFQVPDFSRPPTVSQLLLTYLELISRGGGRDGRALTVALMEEAETLSRRLGETALRLAPALRTLGVDDAYDDAGEGPSVEALLNLACRADFEERFGHLLTAEVMMEWGG